MDKPERQPCPQCGAPNYAGDDICVSCGYDLPPPGKSEPAGSAPGPARPERLRPCPECGVRHYETETVCLACGAALDGYRPRRDPWGMISVLCGLAALVCYGLSQTHKAPALGANLLYAALACNIAAVLLALVSRAWFRSTWTHPALVVALAPWAIFSVFLLICLALGVLGLLISGQSSFYGLSYTGAGLFRLPGR